MSAPTVEDNSLQVRQLELDAAERERLRVAEEERRRDEELAGLRSSAASGARSNATNYFNTQGVVPDAYTPTIEDTIQQILSGLNPDDPNPGAAFTNVGAQAFSTAETAERNRYMRQLEQLFPQNFEYTRVADTLDDPVLAAVQSEERGIADNYLNNLLNRGVITQSGYGAAVNDLGRQDTQVRAMLNELGNLEIEGGRSSLRDVANRARGTASSNPLGNTFDPYSYGGAVDQKFEEWLNSLGSNIRGKVTGPLYKTGGLPVIAGAAQGAGNTRYDPKAVAGLFADDEDEEEDRTSGLSIF